MIRRSTRLVLALAMGLLSLASASLSQPRAAHAEPQAQHTVAFGETLAALAQLTGTTETDLAQLNNVTRGDALAEGQKINLPQPVLNTMRLHRVQTGESLTMIAAQYGMPVRLLSQMNSIAYRSCLTVGQQLRVLAAPSTATADALPAPLISIRVTPNTAEQGDVIIVRVMTQNAVKVEGEFVGRRINFVPDPALTKDKPGAFIGLMGVDALDEPGRYNITITATDAAGTSGSATGKVAVRGGGYITERVAIPPELQGTIDPELSKTEEAEVRAIYSQFTQQQWWDAPFRLPVRGKLLSVYGNHRIYNGVDLGTFHSGYDISSIAGVTVTAAAPGRVAFVKELAVRGNIVIVDHGRGVFTGYFHMRATSVQVGQMVDVGDKLGEVGSTGRSQGNHVHFDLAVGGVAVDPGYWLKVALL